MGVGPIFFSFMAFLAFVLAVLLFPSFPPILFIPTCTQEARESVRYYRRRLSPMFD